MKRPYRFCRRRHAMTLAIPVVLATSALAAPPSKPADQAAFKAIMPPPGLYKVELDGKDVDAGMDGLAYMRRFHLDPDSGAMTQRFQDRAGQSVSVQHAGQGPATTCLHAHTAMAPPFAVNCKAEPSVVVDGELRMASQCGTDHVALAVRKTGPTTWTYKTTILSADVAPEAAGAVGGMAAMPPAILQNLARNGPTADIRAQAARALAEQRARPAGAAVPATSAMPAATGPVRQEITSIQTLTRIAGACAPAGH